MSTYKPETKWQITNDGGLVYNLRQYGWKDGKPAMENDVSLVVNAPPEFRERIAIELCEHLNELYWGAGT